jgi:hypothetical protein
MDIKKLLLVLVLLIVIAFAFILLQPPKDDPIVESKFDLYDANLNEEETLPFPEGALPGPLTTIEFNRNVMVFAEDVSIYRIAFWEVTTLRDGDEFLINDKVFNLTVDNLETQPKISITTENPTDDPEELFDIDRFEIPVTTKSFKFNELGESISFDTRSLSDEGRTLQKIDYYMYANRPNSVPEPTIIYETPEEDEALFTNDRMYFFLKAQEFQTQFGKKVRFLGTDILESKNLQRDYFWPDIPALGNDASDSQHIIAAFEIDEDGDNIYDIKVYVDTGSELPLYLPNESINNYTYLVEYDNGKGINSTEDQAVFTDYGTRIVVQSGQLRIQMPK